MSKKVIDTGAVANDGTGETLREAFEKCNDNFDELYGTDEAAGTTDVEIGTRTIDDAQVATGNTGLITTLFSWLGNMILQITGKSSWRTTPRTTLENAVKLNGDTMTGALILSADPSVALGAVTKQYADSFVQNPIAITGLTGGGANNLDGIATVSLAVGKMLAIRTSTNNTHFYQLVAGTTVENNPYIIRPDDYGAGTNEKVWRLQGLQVDDISADDISADTVAANSVTIALTPSSLNHATTKDYVDNGDANATATADAAQAAANAAQSTASTALTNAATAQTTANAALPKAGGTMVGDIVLAGAPSTGLHPATKTYVDSGDATNATAASAAQTTANAALPKAGGTMTGALVLPIARFSQTAATYGATTTLDFDAEDEQTLTMTGNTTFATSNRAAGRTKLVKIDPGASDRTITYPSWIPINAALPTTFTANKIVILTLKCWGTAETDITASVGAQP